jgi:DNA-binding MarR family transcriptional regulator
MPGASASELADAIGVGSSQLYGLVRALEAMGEVKKRGRGFEVTG